MKKRNDHHPHQPLQQKIAPITEEVKGERKLSFHNVNRAQHFRERAQIAEREARYYMNLVLYILSYFIDLILIIEGRPFKQYSSSITSHLLIYFSHVSLHKLFHTNDPSIYLFVVIDFLYSLLPSIASILCIFFV